MDDRSGEKPNLQADIQIYQRTLLQRYFIQSISKEFDINANYVSQLFKKELGTTFTEHVTNLRIDYACKLLTTTALTLIEIAEKSGYNDYFYFSQDF